LKLFFISILLKMNSGGRTHSPRYKRRRVQEDLEEIRDNFNVIEEGSDREDSLDNFAEIEKGGKGD
jgi:hypothetical protein